MTLASPTDSARFRKFLARADLVLQGRVFDWNPMDGDGHIKIDLVYERVPGDSEVYAAARIERYVSHFTQDELEANAARCRVFLLQKEDNYLPSVVSLLRKNVDQPLRADLQRLKEFVNTFVRDGKLAGARMYSGRLEMDNGLGPGKLLGDDQIAMDFINGHLVHQDPEAAARLENVASSESLTFAVVTKLHDLMRCVYFTREEIRRAIRSGHLVLAPEA